MRIGIDVGGTHTDAVILNGDEVISATKSLTTADVVTGITNALDDILKSGGVREDQIQTVMIGTTQFCLLYTSPSPRDQRGSRMPSSA